MILFATKKMIIFLGKWALYKMIHNLMKRVISSVLCFKCNHHTLVIITAINIMVSHQKLIFKEIFREKI